MPINFPIPSSVGELYSFNQTTWQWSGEYWGVYSAQTGYVTSAVTVGNGFSDISGLTNNTLFLKGFSGTNINIVDNGDTLTFSSFDNTISAFTYSSNTFDIIDSSGVTYSATIDVVTGLTVNGNLNVTGTSQLDGQISSLSLSGATDRLVQVDGSGIFTATQQIVSAYISSASTEASLLVDVNNWDINGNYTGMTSITGTFQGQKYYDNNYFFEAVQDNIFIRLIRG